MPIKKKVVKKEPTHMNVRIDITNYNLIRDYCKEKGYKIGVFIETAAFNRMTREINEKYSLV